VLDNDADADFSYVFLLFFQMHNVSSSNFQ